MNAEFGLDIPRLESSTNNGATAGGRIQKNKYSDSLEENQTVEDGGNVKSGCEDKKCEAGKTSPRQKNPRIITLIIIIKYCKTGGPKVGVRGPKSQEAK